MIKKSSEKKLVYAIISVVFGLYLTNLAYLIYNKTGISYVTVSNFCRIVILITLIISVVTIIKRFNVYILCFLLSFLALILVQSFFFTENIKFADTLNTFISTVLPIVILFSVIRDYGLLYQGLQMVSLMIAVITALMFQMKAISTFSENYAMGFSNSMILPTIVLIDMLIDRNNRGRKRLVLLILIFVNMLVISIYGSRGSFISIALYPIYLFAQEAVRKKSKRGIFVVILCVLTLIFFAPIMTGLQQFISKLGYTSRTLDLMANDITHDSGRFELWRTLFENIKINPFAIKGINADYLVIGGYSHNFFIELIYAFGVPIGGSCGIFILINIIWTLTQGTETKQSKILVMLLFVFFPICLWSESIWTSMYFWAWLTVLYKNKRLNIGRER